MYQIYNVSTGLYGLTYKTLTTAKAMAHAYSLWTRAERAVVDMTTGEVMAIYDSGKETYLAKA